MKNVLAELRQSKNLTQEQLAAAVGVTRQTIISIEREKFNPNLALAYKLAKEFDCRVEDIFPKTM
ncbi:helix-turn-helix transcriptional regulator [Rathayibacter toxicus]|uniref:helix-turn-helix transcriptional regulator n=1 Tax=Rathayibacter toxicus TaxID=145458 RepID=UPI001C04B64E|nr:helix-turn-helix transcriptional regulator [Rathayibacter toxicus]QWL31172.1 transcriptional regulator [Rathayibacter toxicus]QWL33262.1 transcriptional regulator [Rathayibacter toxicus]QWL35357.1 transcriptional regulator [Rathayibacter toxicus]QWL37487.1 transcriptional regulator [Rathayibacter toxicus]QWL39581.1 transcriptional regulator [Rathayibacter toxicus]